MVNTINTIIRSRLPETNSSSSHSVVIDSVTSFKDVPKEYYELPTDEEGYLIIKAREFGREWNKFNSIVSKIQYTAGLIHGRANTDPEVFSELSKLEKIIVNFTGVKGVIFSWLPEYYNDVIETYNSEDYVDILDLETSCCPSIDHQSMDLYEEVLESEETIKNFIFKPSSWLLLGSDDYYPTDDYFNVNSKKPEAIVRIMLPDPIGPVDYPLTTYPGNLYHLFNNSDMRNILYSIGIDKKSKKTFSCNRGINKDDCLFIRILCEDENDHLKLYWASDKFMKEFSLKEKENMNKILCQNKRNNHFQTEHSVFNETKKELPDEFCEISIKIISEKYGDILL